MTKGKKIMYFAILNNKKISIKEATKDNVYTCPVCGEIMIPKQGKIMVWHFAHKTKVNCVDYYDNKGEWHREMQELFPERNREIYNNYCNRHIFDILTDSNRIIEFQHSALSKEQFNKRTKDYVENQLHYKFLSQSKYLTFIWVFDFTEKEIKIKKPKNKTNRWRNFHWSRASKLFDGYDLRKHVSEQDLYELWFMINPYKYEHYELKEINGFEMLVKEKEVKRCGIGFVKVKIKKGNYFGGECYTKEQFIKYITSQ